MPTSISMTEEVDIQWGTVKAITKTKTFYSCFISEGVKYSLYDNVEVNNGSDGDDADPYIGKIVKLWEEKEGGARKVLVRWFFRPKDLNRETEGDSKELYLAFGMGKGVTNENDLEVICGKCKVLCTAKDARNLEPSATDLNNADFFFSKIYNVDLQHVSPVQRVVDKLGCEVLYNKPEWVTEAPKNKEKAGEQLNSLQRDSILKRKAQCMGDTPLDLKDKQRGTDVVNDTQQRVGQMTDLTKQQVSSGNKVTQNKKLKTAATTSPSTKVATTKTLQNSENASSLGEAIANKVPTSGDFARASSKVEQEEEKEAVLSTCVPAQTSLTSSDLERPLPPAKPSASVENASLKVDDALEPQAARQLDEKGIVENDVVQVTHIDIQETREEGQTGSLMQAKSSSGLLKREQERTLHEKVEMDISASASKVEGEYKEAVKIDHKIGVSLETKADTSSLQDPKIIVKDSIAKEAKSNVSKKPLSSTGSVLEKKLGTEKKLVSSESFRAENWKIFKELPWEQNLQQGTLSGRVLLLQNLDPCLTSADVRDMLKNIFQGVSDARIIPQETLCPYAPALAIFESKLLADSALQEMEQKCLVVTSSRRPIIACKFKENTNVSRFPGHLALEKFKLGRNSAADEYKKAVSTSHCSQPNTIEYEMAMEWRRLQEIIQTCRAELFERQRKEMEEIRKGHAS